MMRVSNLHEALVANVTFPVTNGLFNRRGVRTLFNTSLESEHSGSSELKNLQMNKFRRVVAHAQRWCDFYARRFREIGLESPEDIRTVDDIRRIPPLSRQDVVDCHREMVDRRYAASIVPADHTRNAPGAPAFLARFRRYPLVRNTSSGSTGSPVVCFEDGSTTARSWAHEMRLKHWFHIAPGAREMRFARISTDYHPNTPSMLLRRLLWNQCIVPGVNLRAVDFQICAEKLLQFRPEVLWGFTSAIAGLANHLKETARDLGDYRPRLIITWAAPLYPQEEHLLREVFQCPVTNLYGMREVGHIAARCPEGQLHINMEHLYLETDSPASSTGSEDEAGELLVTSLWESPMPFIRYRTGDLGQVTPSTCACGRTLETLANFLGRTGEVFKTRDGRLISPNFWCRCFMDHQRSRAVRRFQIVYTKERNIRIRLQRGDSFTPESEAQIRAFLTTNLGEATGVSFEYVEDIPLHTSGKYQMVLNENAENRG
jgi:phenylacetate-CoA ligase